MAKKNMSDKSLANLSKSRFDSDTARIANAKSHEAKKAYKPFKDVLKDLMPPEEWAEIAAALKDKAKDGDVRAAEFLRDTLGEKPKEEHKIETDGIVFSFDGVDKPMRS